MSKKQTALTGEIYDWVSSMTCAHIGKSPNHIYFSGKNRRGTISFYEGYIIELSVENSQTGESVFYIHFAIEDIQETKENIRIFFQFLQREGEKVEKLDLTAIRQVKPVKLLISCSCGITSSYFAFLMQQALNQAGTEIRADAVSFTDVDRVQEQYDYILLAPQIRYMLPKFRERYGDKVLGIDLADFASRNVNRVLNLIVKREYQAA